MATYSWIGVSGPWTAASFWTVNGSPNGNIPGAGDDALVASPGTYTITVLGAQANSLTISDPNATVESTGPVGVSGTTYIPGVLSVGATTNAGTIDITGDGVMVSGAGTFVNTGMIIVNGGAGAAGGLPGTLEVKGEYTTANLGSIQNTAGGQVILQGTLDNTGSVFDANAYGGTFGLTLSQITINGGTLDFGTNEVQIGGGLLDGVTVHGDLHANAIVEGGLTVESAAGTLPGTIYLQGGNQLTFLDTETLDNVNVVMGYSFTTNSGILIDSGQTLTLGPHALVSAIETGTIAGGIGGNALVAEGTITTDNSSLFLDPDTFVNTGLVQATDGGQLGVGSTTPSNAGTIEATSGGTVAITHAITGAGTIALADGTLGLDNLYGQQAFTFSGFTNLLTLAVVAGSNTAQDFVPGDTIEIVGTPVSVNYASGTLAIQAGATTLGSFVMQGAPTAAQFSASIDTSNNTFITETLPSATYTWTGGAGAWTAASQWTVGGVSTGGIPGFGPADTALIAAAGTYTIGLAVPETVQNLDVSNADATVEIGSTLGIGIAGAGTIQNDGVIALDSGASLAINGQYALADLGTIDNSGGIVTLGGTLENAGKVLKASDFGGVAFGTISIEGGTLELDNGTPTLTGSLDGVTVQGTLIPDLAIRGGLTVESLGGGLPGLIEMAQGNSLEFLDSETLDDVAITMDLGNPPIPPSAIFIDAQQTLTLGPHAPITVASEGGNAVIDGATGSGAGVSTLISEGTIDANSELDIGVSGSLALSNSGLIESSNAAAIVIDATTLSNTGTILAEGGRIGISAAMVTNSGTMFAESRQFSVSGTALANSGTILADDGFVYIDAAAPSNSGELLAENNSTLELTQNLTGAGTIALANASTFMLNGGYDQQTFAFSGTGDTLSLGVLAGTNTVQGFTPGNTIEVESTPVSVNFAAGTLAVQSGSITLADFVMSGVPANAQFSVAVDGDNNSYITDTIPCFAAGMRILTASGEVPVQELRIGDQVATLRGCRFARVVWLGHRHLDCLRHPRPADVWPVRITAGAITDGVPHHDLWLSPEHAVLLRVGQQTVLVPIRHLLNGTSIAQVPVPSITYWHVELASHDAIVAEGAPAETYLDTGNRADFANGGPAVTVHPTFADAVWHASACAPQLRHGDALAALRYRLAIRAARSVHWHPTPLVGFGCEADEGRGEAWPAVHG